MNISKLIKNTPYQDLYDPLKNYIQLLAVPGRVAQAREFTEVQSTILDLLSRVSDTIFTEGTIVSGCAPTVVPVKDSNGNIISYNVKIDPGSMYLNGIIHKVEAQTLSISGSGTECVYASLKEDIITANLDEALKDPALGNENANMMGMDRLRIKVLFSTSDTEGNLVYTFVNGVLQIPQEDDPYAKFNDILARRTYDESGNYKVDGLVLTQRVEREQREAAGSSKISMNLSAGKAYVLGFEVLKPVSTYPAFRKSFETASVLTEQKRVYTGTTLYQLVNSPVAIVSHLTADFKRICYAVTRSSVSYDSFNAPYDGVKSILKVYQGTEGQPGYTLYTEGTQYILDNGVIKWITDAPSTGDQYFIDFIYTRVINRDINDNVIDMAAGSVGRYLSVTTDAKDISYINYNYIGQYMTTNGEVSAEDFAADPETWKPQILDQLWFPVENSYFSVTYTYYLGRMDLMCLNKDGGIDIIEGMASTKTNMKYPTFLPKDKLALAAVFVLPNSDSADILNLNTTRLSMADLAILYNRIKNVEYNQAISDLDKEAVEGVSATLLKGVFTDGFIGFTKSDLSYTDPIDIGIGPSYSAMIIPEEGALSIPDTVVYSTPVADKNNNNFLSNDIYLMLKPNSEKLLISQTKMTGVMNVNPYQVYAKYCPIILNPKEDHWISEKIFSSERNITTSNTSLDPKLFNSVNGDPDLSSVQSQFDRNGVLGRITTPSTPTTITTTSINTSVRESITTYMRSRVIDVKASGFVSNAQNISGHIGGIKVDLTPKVGSGTTLYGSGNVNADSEGNVNVSFVIPPNQIPSGTVSFTLKAGALNEGSGETAYTSKGIERTVIRTTTRHTFIPYTPPISINVDPLAQIFVLERPAAISSVDLFFSSKDTELPVIVRLSGVTNGYPNREIYAEKIVYPSSINTFTPLQAPVATSVSFDKDIILEAGEYAVIIMTESSGYNMYVAKLGEQILRSSDYIKAQPYIAGALFSSSNASTWTAHQDVDLAFNIYCYEFANKTVSLSFQRLNLEPFHMFNLLVGGVVPDGTSIRWKYSIDGGEHYIDFEPNNIIDLGSNYNTLQFRAELTSSGNLSPVLEIGSVGLLTYIQRFDSSYISRSVSFDDIEKFTTLKLYYEVDKTSTYGTVEPQFSIETDPVTGFENWQDFDLSSADPDEYSENDVSYIRKGVCYVKEFSDPVEHYRIRLNLKNTSAGVGKPPKVYRLMSIFTDGLSQ